MVVNPAAAVSAMSSKCSGPKRNMRRAKGSRSETHSIAVTASITHRSAALRRRKAVTMEALKERFTKINPTMLSTRRCGHLS